VGADRQTNIHTNIHTHTFRKTISVNQVRVGGLKKFNQKRQLPGGAGQYHDIYIDIGNIHTKQYSLNHGRYYHAHKSVSVEQENGGANCCIR